MAKRMNVTLTEEMHTALKEYAFVHGGSIAYNIRQILYNTLSNDGIEVIHVHPTWGGNRKSADNTNVVDESA